MATPQLSPGVLVREVDLTLGRADNVLDNIGAIAGPFRIGPVDDPVDIATEQQLINTFGKPMTSDTQYEYWLSAANYLSYGGVLKVVRTDGTDLKSANAGVGTTSITTLKIKNQDDYLVTYKNASNFTYAAKNPGTWANQLKVCYIDDYADQTIGIATTSLSNIGAEVGLGITATLDNVAIPGAGTTTGFTGFLKGIIVGVRSDANGVSSQLDVKVVSRVETVGGGSTETAITYSEGFAGASFGTGTEVNFVTSAGVNTTGLGAGNFTPATAVDWYDQQTLGLTNATVFWKSIAPRPTTTNYTANRKGKNDALHIAVYDDTGAVTGIQANLLEKHVSLSKANDAISSVIAPQRIYYKDYLAEFSENIYAGANPSQADDTENGSYVRATGFSTGFVAVTTGDGLFGQDARGVTFSAIGNVTYTLGGGSDYSTSGGMSATLANLVTSYELFANKQEVEVDFLIMGPGGASVSESQAKANKLIAIAENRKDCIAVVGPHRGNLIGVTNTTTQTNNLINYFSVLSSSSYAVFDSGYKFQYDRFNNEFVYVPCNPDVAGMMARTSVTAFPWFSPAGQQRGVLNNAIKLAYNPSKAERDRLYPQRVNSFITTPGVGTILFGDKTALSYASTFDRINVRRLFLTIEQGLERAAQAQLFEFNDEITRANFRNIVEPYLRDIQAKRGLYGFLVVCDSTNNTPDVIDNNEFRADIFLKPAKSINYITLTFVATRTGVSFEEVAGRV